jgi:CHAT domain-containing protein/tetratricopeptide (TPR) repeat protein
MKTRQRILWLSFLMLLLAVPVRADTGNNEIEGGLRLNEQAVALYQKGQYQEALPLFQQSLAINEKAFGPDSANVAAISSYMALLYEASGQYDKALLLFLRSLNISEKAYGAQHTATADVLSNLAELYGLLGQYDKALSLYQRALTIYEKVNGRAHTSTANTLGSMGALYGVLDQFDKALPLLQQNLVINEKVLKPDDPAIAASLNNLAELYRRLGKYDEALPLYERALAIQTRTQRAESGDTAAVLHNLALLYQNMGQLDLALTFELRALSIKEKVLGSEHADIAYSLLNLANLYQSLGQYDRALPLLQRALLIAEKALGNYHAATVLSMDHLGVLYDHTGKPDEALPLFQRAYRSAQSARIPEILAAVQDNLGEHYAARGNPSTAIFYLKAAVNTMQGIRAGSRGLDKTLQKSLLKKNEAIYRKLAKLLIEAGRLAEAQQVLAMLKEDEYFDFIRRDEQADVRVTRMSYSGAEKPYAEGLDKLGQDGTALAEQLDTLNTQARLGSSPDAEKQRTVIRTKLAEQEQQTVALLNEIAIKLPAAQQQQSAQQRAEQSRLSAGMQQQLAQLGQGVTLVQYLLMGDKIQILVTDAKHQVVREAPLGEAALYPKLVELRKVLEDPRYDPRPLAQELYQSLIAPVESDIKHSRTLMLSLDGALRYIPFAALYDGKHYLVERYQLALYTSAAKDKLAAASKPQWKISGLGVTQGHEGFSELPGVKAELAGIIGRNGLPGEIHLDQEFTARQMQASLKQANPVLHIASHFKFTPGTEADSYLLLGDGSHLSLKDIRQGDYPFGQLDLLTLSACATAMQGGREANGKEVEGFGALAQNKGAKAVLASLWPIADASTAQLMQTLYRHRQQQHLNKAEALRQAQLALLNGEQVLKVSAISPDIRGGTYVQTDGQTDTGSVPFKTDPKAPFAHPYYWAPFILMGNWL